MSIRVFIEVNCDFLRTLDDPVFGTRLRTVLRSTGYNADLNAGRVCEPLQGIRILGSRHHSETLFSALSRIAHDANNTTSGRE